MNGKQSVIRIVVSLNSKKSYLKILRSCALCHIYMAFVFMICSCEHETIEKKLPNIVFVFADDQRAGTIGALGNAEIITPNLDRLVHAGTSFTNAYIMGSHSGAVCQPSRAMLLTGKYLNNLEGDGYILPETDSTLGQSLQRAGYACFGIGKYHSQPQSYLRIFDDGRDIFFGGMHDQWNVPLNSFASVCNYRRDMRPVIKDFTASKEVSYEQGEYMFSGRHSTDIFADAAIDFIRNYHSEKPFFLYVALMSPHDPRSTHQKYLDMYDTAVISIPPNFMPEHPFDNGELKVRDELLAPFPRTESIVKEHIRDYYAMITHNDEKLGEIFDALQNKGLYENTIVIYSGDNGLAVGQHGLMGKQNLYEHSIKVPLLISGKGIPVNQRSDAFLYLTDVYPTICELAGISIPGSVDGYSFFPSLLNPESSHRDYIVTTYKSYQRAIRDHQYKLITYHVKEESHTQLFDLIQDPRETNDIANDPEYTDEITELDNKLHEQLRILNDTIWN